MSILIFKINKKVKIEYIKDDNESKEVLPTFIIHFKFNNHNQNWLYLKLNRDDTKKIKEVLNSID